MNDAVMKLLTSDNSEEVVKGLVDEYKPIIYQIGREILSMMKDYANNKEIFEVSATLKRNQFDAYVEAGFTEDQALAFILNDNLKLLKQLEKSSANVSTK
jgi:hypothetical protein